MQQKCKLVDSKKPWGGKLDKGVSEAEECGGKQKLTFHERNVGTNFPLN